MMKYYEEFSDLEVFNLEEASEIVGNKNNAKVLLNSYLKKGFVERIRRNLYCFVGFNNNYSCNRYLIGSKINSTSYLGYHSAIELHGLSHQVSNVVYVLSDVYFKDFEFEGFYYKYSGKGIKNGISTYKMNKDIKYTDLERSIVDCIDRPIFCGGENEIDEILKISPVLNEESLMKYLEEYNKKILYQKVGFFMEKYQENLNISNLFLEKIEARIGKTNKYLNEEAKNGKGFLVKRWNLIVPYYLDKKGELFV
jgi:predicted transcriptional regulator of viral defense system